LVSVIEFEDLSEVVLVGHSLSCGIVPFVAERVPARIRRVVFIAGGVLRDGETAEEIVLASPWLRAAIAEGLSLADADRAIDLFLQDGTDEDRDWVRARLTRQPAAAGRALGRLTAFLALNLPTGFIRCLRDRAQSPELAAEMVARLPDPIYREIDSGHDCMISQPEATVRALLDMV
jgi:pimeloyl-ACP methyl ester carboxylesterase